MRITQVSSVFTTTHAWTSVAVAGVRASATPRGRRIPMARPPAATAEPTMKRRREEFMSCPPTGGHVDGRANALVGPAPADVRHRVVDVLVGRLRIALQQRRRGHDLSGLAVTTLRHVERRPRLLN